MTCSILSGATWSRVSDLLNFLFVFICGFKKNAEYDLIQFWHGQTDLKFINFCPFCPKQFLWNCHLVKFLCFDQLISNSAESHLQSGERLKSSTKEFSTYEGFVFPLGEDLHNFHRKCWLSYINCYLLKQFQKSIYSKLWVFVWEHCPFIPIPLFFCSVKYIVWVSQKHHVWVSRDWRVVIWSQKLKDTLVLIRKTFKLSTNRILWILFVLNNWIV